jgi:cytochrome c-type biogenesis protein CcmH
MTARPLRRYWLPVAFALWWLMTLSAGANEPSQPVAPVAAPIPQPLLNDETVETRLRELSKELRCVVCQNEALSDSPADLAESMRQEIRDLMRSGKSDQEVIDFLTARYGDFVLFRPPFKPLTYLLWIGPFVFLGLGVVVWFVALRARRTFKSTPVSREQIAAAARLLEEKP